MNKFVRNQLIMFIIMMLVGIFFNPMNILSYRFSDLYFSLTLFYGGVLMASNMIWAHEIVHYLSNKNININMFLTGIVLSILVSLIMRNQVLVNDKQWLKRMISHHSTALTTSNKIYKRTKNEGVKKLAKEIIDTQEKEIKLMKSML